MEGTGPGTGHVVKRESVADPIWCRVSKSDSRVDWEGLCRQAGGVRVEAGASSAGRSGQGSER